MFRKLRAKIAMLVMESLVDGITPFQAGDRVGVRIDMTPLGKWLCGMGAGEPEREPTEDEILAARINAAEQEGRENPVKCDCGETHGRPKAKA